MINLSAMEAAQRREDARHIVQFGHDANSRRTAEQYLASRLVMGTTLEVGNGDVKPLADEIREKMAAEAGKGLLIPGECTRCPRLVKMPSGVRINPESVTAIYESGDRYSGAYIDVALVGGLAHAVDRLPEASPVGFDPAKYEKQVQERIDKIIALLIGES